MDAKEKILLSKFAENYKSGSGYELIDFLEDSSIKPVLDAMEEYAKQKREEKDLQILNILSNQFRMHGWSPELKKLHTSIVLSIKNTTDK